MRVGRKTVNQNKKDLNQPKTSSNQTTGFSERTSSTTPQNSNNANNQQDSTTTTSHQLTRPSLLGSSNRREIITTTTSAHTNISNPTTTQSDNMTFGGADRSNLSLPTRRRHPTIDHATLSAAATSLFENGNGGISRPENMMEILMTMLSPDTQRSFTDLSPGQFRAPIAPSLHAAATAAATLHNEILETPTPTKVIYPKTVTEEQAKFVEGFNQALRQVQIQNQFANNPTPSLQSPSIANILLNLLTPTLAQPPAFPAGASNLSSPIDAAHVVVTRPDGTEALVQLSPTAPNSSSTTTTLSPSSDNSLTNQLASSSSASALSAISTAAAASKAGATANTLSELVKQLNTTQASDYMDIFHPTSIGDLSSSAQFSQFMQQSSSATATASSAMLPPHIPQSSASSLQRHQNSMAIKVEPTPLHSTPPPAQPLSVAVSALTAAAMQQNGYGQGQLMHLNGQNPMHGSCAPQMGHQQATTSGGGSVGRYNGHGHGVDMDDQERKKLERKRARNRAAASKCRQRKLERIQELEGHVQQERQRNAQLQSAIEKAQHDLQQLRATIDDHRHAGCSLPTAFN